MNHNRFHAIYEILSQEIRDGRYAEGLLPSEKKLCERFSVERNTLRKALKMLAEEHLIETMPGIGSRVVTPQETMEENAEKGNILFFFRSISLSPDHIGLYHLRIFNEMREAVGEMGFTLIFQPVDAHLQLSEVLTLYHPVALISDSYMSDHFYRAMADSGLPCLSLNHDTPLISSILPNNTDGAYLALKTLAQRQHQQIACLLGKSAYQSCSERMRGVIRAAEEFGLSIHYLNGNWLYDSGYALGKEVLELYRRHAITAVFAFNDDMGYGCMQYLTEQGLEIPRDLSIIGFDNSETSKQPIKLTSIEVNAKSIIDYCRLLLRGILLDGRPIPRAKILIETSVAPNDNTCIEAHVEA